MRGAVLRRAVLRKGVLLGGALLLGACAGPGVAERADVPWVPPPSVHLPQSKAVPEKPNLPEGFSLENLPKELQLTLPQVVDIALKNNPRTTELWAQARAQAAAVYVQRSGLYPQVDLVGDLTRVQQAFGGGAFDFKVTQVAPALVVNWVLFDWSRFERIQEAERLLVAADFTQNQALQDVVWQVEQAYIQYLNAKALLEVQDVTIRSAQASLDAARVRQEAGLATIADVLQAQTAVASAEFQRATFQGQLDSVKGALATAMGLPANLPVEVGLLPADVPVAPLTAAVETLIDTALGARADLAAAKARALAAGSRAGQARTGYLPTLAASGTFNETYWLQRTVPSIGGGGGGGGAQRSSAFQYSLALEVRLPLFNGFATYYGVESANALEEAARAQVQELEQAVVLQVWTAYAGLRTTAAQVASAKALLESATRAFEVNQGRYQAGVGSILDLLSAQASLANARATEVQARSAWFLSLAQLAYAAGTLQPPQSGEAPVQLPGLQVPPLESQQKPPEKQGTPNQQAPNQQTPNQQTPNQQGTPAQPQQDQSQQGGAP